MGSIKRQWAAIERFITDSRKFDLAVQIGFLLVALIILITALKDSQNVLLVKFDNPVWPKHNGLSLTVYEDAPGCYENIGKLRISLAEWSNNREKIVSLSEEIVKKANSNMTAMLKAVMYRSWMIMVFVLICLVYLVRARVFAKRLELANQRLTRERELGIIKKKQEEQKLQDLGIGYKYRLQTAKKEIEFLKIRIVELENGQDAYAQEKMARRIQTLKRKSAKDIQDLNVRIEILVKENVDLRGQLHICKQRQKS